MTVRARMIQQALTVRNQLLDPLYWPRSRDEFLQRAQAAETPEAAVDLLWHYQGDGFYRTLRPNQDRGEVLGVLKVLQAHEPRVIVEIGTRDGGSLFLWSRTGPQLDLLVSIDLPGGIHGGGYAEARAKLYRLFTQDQDCELHLLRANSQLESTRQQLETVLDGHPIDFLFIDADHRYEGVKRDYELYRDLVRPGGLIGFHDIKPNTIDPTIQVNQLWDEIRASGLTTHEIVHEPYTGRYGIGLVTQE